MRALRSCQRLPALGAVALLVGTACRTPPKDGGDDPDASDADGITEVDSGLLADTGADSGGAADGGGSDTGSSDAGEDSSGGGDPGGASDGSSGGGTSGDGGSGDGDSGGSGEETPEELCNGIDDDGDGLIDEDVCPDVTATDPSTGRTYLVVGAAMQWFEAAAYCESHGYTLATIDDQAENDFLWELIYDGEDGVHTANAHTWIGLHEDVGTAWAWHDGTATGGFDASSGLAVTDDYGSVVHGQAMAFGDDASAVWFEAPQTWYHHAVCESAAP